MEALIMMAYHYQQLSEGYSQLAAATPKLAPGEIVKALVQLPAPPPHACMTSVIEAVLLNYHHHPHHLYSHNHHKYWMFLCL